MLSRSMLLALVAPILLAITGVASAQVKPTSTTLGQATPKTYHPTITSLSTRTPTPGQTLTINGSDLLPPTWTATLQYHDKYGGNFHELALSGSNSALTFIVPSNVRPDSIAIQYRNASNIDAASNPIPQNEQRPFVPIIQVQQRPKIDTASLLSVTSQSSPFHVLAPGPRTVKGQFFLKPPVFSVNLQGGTTGGVIPSPTLTSTTTIDESPTVTVAGSSISVTDPRYIPTSRDEATITVPTTFPHNATGFLKFATPAGVDSTLVTVAQPPQTAKLFEDTGTPVTNGVLFIGHSYSIRGRNLAVFQLVSGSVKTNIPTVRLGSVSLTDFNLVTPLTVSVPGGVDTVVFFKVPNLSSGGTLSLSHIGGSISLGTFSVVAAPAPLQISGAVITPNDVIAGTSATITLSLNPTPTNFAAAGELSIGIPASLASAISPIPSVLITANPMTITVPTKVIQTTATGSINIHHNTPSGGSANVSVTVRPPRPTAVVIAPDTIPGSKSATASVSFDLPGPATVILSSSNPTVASIPASVVRSGNTATFTVNTVQVTAPQSITISASLNGVSASKTIVVRPGRLASVAANPSTVNAGENVPLTLTFDAPVSSVPVTLTSSDTTIRSVSNFTANGSTVQASLSTTKTLISSVNATITVAAGTESKTAAVQVNPIQIAQFTISPASGTGGTTVAATIRLSRPVLQTQFINFSSSDTTAATAPTGFSFSFGEDVKIVTVTLRGPQATSKTATITANCAPPTTPARLPSAASRQQP
jgi:hypothetical protein